MEIDSDYVDFFCIGLCCCRECYNNYIKRHPEKKKSLTISKPKVEYKKDELDEARERYENADNDLDRLSALLECRAIEKSYFHF